MAVYPQLPPSDCFLPPVAIVLQPYPGRIPPPLQCRDIKAFVQQCRQSSTSPPTHGLCVPAAVNRLCLAEPRQSAGSSKNSQNLTLGRQFKRKFSTKCNKWKSYNFAILQKKTQKVSRIKWKFLPLWSENFAANRDLPPRSWPQRDRNSIDFRWSAIGEIVSQGRREFSD